MKPHVYRRCRNPECPIYDQEIELVPEKERWFFISSYCDKCHHDGAIRFLHGTIEADSSEAFYAKVGGMAKEFHLLKKLIKGGVAEDSDLNRHGEILDQIKDLECTGCGQKLIDHEH